MKRGEQMLQKQMHRWPEQALTGGLEADAVTTCAQIAAQTDAHTGAQTDAQTGAQTDAQTGAQTDAQTSAQTHAQTDAHTVTQAIRFTKLGGLEANAIASSALAHLPQVRAGDGCWAHKASQAGSIKHQGHWHIPCSKSLRSGTSSLRCGTAEVTLRLKQHSRLSLSDLVHQLLGSKAYPLQHKHEVWEKEWQQHWDCSSRTGIASQTWSIKPLRPQAYPLHHKHQVWDKEQ